MHKNPYLDQPVSSLIPNLKFQDEEAKEVSENRLKNDINENIFSNILSIQRTKTANQRNTFLRHSLLALKSKSNLDKIWDNSKETRSIKEKSLKSTPLQSIDESVSG